MKKSSFVWLLIVPAIVMTFNFFFVKNQEKFFMNWTDPSYAYLFNGMNLANGTMEVGHVDHPGTTIQMAAAVFIKAIHVVSGKNPDLVTDVLSDPEKYLHALSFIFVLACSIVLFYLGSVIKRVSNNLALAVFMQSGILVSFISLTCMADIRTEPFLILGGFILVALLFSFIHEKEISTRRMYGYSIKFAAICGFLIVSKMTAIPLIILPIFLLRKWRSWILYSSGLVAFAALFMIPALSKMNFLISWIVRLFTHTGMYGSGEAKIVDVNAFKWDLWYMFRDDLPFTISCLLMLSTILFLTFAGKFKFRFWKENASLRLLMGIFLVTVVCILIVAKHFKYHYLIPADSLMMLGAYLSLRLTFPSTSKGFHLLRNKTIQIVGVVLIIGLCSFIDIDRYDFYENFKNPKSETASVMAKYKNVPRLYMTYEYYFAEVPPALYFGTCYAGTTRFEYYAKLKKLYPKSYFYSIVDNEFHQWGSTFELSDLVNKNKQTLVSFYVNDTTIVEQSLAVLRQLNRGNKVIDLKRVYVNTTTGERLYEMNRIGEMKTIPDSALVTICDVEKILDGSLISNDESLHFQGIEAKTNKEKHSGSASLELTNTIQFGMGFEIKVNVGDHFEISAWRKSAEGRGVLVVTGMNGKFYKSSSSVVEQGENGWEKIRMSVDIPSDYIGGSLKGYAWNEGEKSSIYFDDLTIVQY